MAVHDHQLLYKLASDALRIETINFMEFFRLHGQKLDNDFYCDKKENLTEHSQVFIFYKIKNKLIDQLIEVYIDKEDAALLRYFNSSQKDLEVISQFLSRTLQKEINIPIWQSI